MDLRDDFHSSSFLIDCFKAFLCLHLPGSSPRSQAVFGQSQARTAGFSLHGGGCACQAFAWAARKRSAVVRRRLLVVIMNEKEFLTSPTAKSTLDSSPGSAS